MSELVRQREKRPACSAWRHRLGNHLGSASGPSASPPRWILGSVVSLEEAQLSAGAVCAIVPCLWRFGLPCKVSRFDV